METTKFNRNKYVFTSIPAMSLVGESMIANRSKQLTLFLQELDSYNILLRDLVNFPLKESDRNVALNIAYYIKDIDDLEKSVKSKKDLPITRLSRAINIKSNYLQKMRDYILAYYIIFSNKQYKLIQDYFRIKLKEDNREVINLPNKKIDEIHRGIVVASFKKSVYVLNSKGEFLKLKTIRRPKIGELADGKQKKGIRDYKIHISIALIILVFLCCAIVAQYRKIETIVVIQINSNIKLHVNKFDKVIYAYSPTEKGKTLLESTDVLNKNIDDAMAEIFDYAFDNQMIDLSKKSIITINGKQVKYGELSKTNKFLEDKNVPILINNGGNQQKLPQSFEQEEKAESKK